MLTSIELSDKPRERHDVVVAAAARSDLNLAELLRHVLADDDDRVVRAAAARVLKKYDSASTERALLDAVRADPADNVVLRAAETLGKLGSEAAVPELAKLMSRSDLAARVIAARALASIDASPARAELRRAVDDRRRLVASIAARALAETGDASDHELIASRARSASVLRRGTYRRALRRIRADSPESEGRSAD